MRWSKSSYSTTHRRQGVEPLAGPPQGGVGRRLDLLDHVFGVVGAGRDAGKSALPIAFECVHERADPLIGEARPVVVVVDADRRQPRASGGRRLAWKLAGADIDFIVGVHRRQEQAVRLRLHRAAHARGEPLLFVRARPRRYPPSADQSPCPGIAACPSRW